MFEHTALEHEPCGTPSSLTFKSPSANTIVGQEIRTTKAG